MFRHYEEVLKRIVDQIMGKLPDRVLSVYAFLVPESGEIMMPGLILTSW